MCGIAFYWREGGYSEANRVDFEQAVNALSHRGPDEKQVQGVGNALLGHTRLSIVDLSQSHQPMACPDKLHYLVFNGEIYNYQELRADLDADWNFTTAGDTEVLLAGLVVHGVQFLDRLQGMWSFVFWNTETETAVLSRDRTGKKPLYYSCSGKHLCVASELPALVKMQEKTTQNLSGLSNYFRYGFFLPGETAYEEISELEAGHYLVVKNAKVCRREAYWTPQRSIFTGTKNEAFDMLSDRLEKAVKRRLVADVEIGCFLSGGVDSSIIAALARKLSDSPIKTFTIGFQSRSYDEREHARSVSRFLGTRHFEKLVEQFNPEQFNNLLLHHLGQPFYDSSILPTQAVSLLAAEHVKVALSGDGSDELFCGYQRYKSRRLAEVYSRLPLLVRNSIAKVIRTRPEPTDHHSGSILKKAHLFLNLFDRIESERPYIGPRLCSEAYHQKLFPGLSDALRSPQVEDAFSVTEDEVVAMMLSDFSNYLPQDIHTKVDRASMSASLEVRAPFMDTDVVELAHALPRAWLMSWRFNKPVLREAFGDLLPKHIWRRRKQGFAVPIAEWFHSSLAKEFIGHCHRQRSKLDYINFDEALRLLDTHRTGRVDNSQLLWCLYSFLVWNDNEMNARAS